MSKKQLNEVRRFMKLANLNGNITSNFIKETYGAGYMHEEEEIEDVSVEDEDTIEDEVMGLDGAGLEDEMGPPVAEIEGGGDAEELVLNIVNDIQQLASLAGVDVDVEGDEAVEDDMDMDIDMEMGPDDEMDIEGDIELDTEEPAEETLEEMINAILAEDPKGTKKGGRRKTARPAYELEEEISDEDIDGWLKGDKKMPSKQQSDDDDLAKLQARAAEEDTPEDKGREEPRRRAKRPTRNTSAPLKGVAPQNESVQILDDEKLIQEVTKRVKKRLAKYARAQKRQRRQRR